MFCLWRPRSAREYRRSPAKPVAEVASASAPMAGAFGIEAWPAIFEYADHFAHIATKCRGIHGLPEIRDVRLELAVGRGRVPLHVSLLRNIPKTWIACGCIGRHRREFGIGGISYKHHFVEDMPERIQSAVAV